MLLNLSEHLALIGAAIMRRVLVACDAQHVMKVARHAARVSDEDDGALATHCLVHRLECARAALHDDEHPRHALLAAIDLSREALECGAVSRERRKRAESGAREQGVGSL